MADTEQKTEAPKSELPRLAASKRPSPFAKVVHMRPEAVPPPPTIAEQTAADPNARPGLVTPNVAEQTANKDLAVSVAATDTASPLVEARKSPTAQARATSEIRSETGTGKVPRKISAGDDLMHVQTQMPADTVMAFKLLCRNERISVRDAVAKFVSDALKRGSI